MTTSFVAANSNTRQTFSAAEFAVGLVVILCAAAIFLFGFDRLYDLQLQDEAGYFQRGQWILSGNRAQIGNPSFAPLYSEWYSLLFRLFGAEPQTYFINLGILAVLTPALVFVFVHLASRNVIYGLFAGFVMLVSVHNLTAWPKVASFALVLVLIGLIASHLLRKQPAASLIALATALWIAAYARPEMLLAAAVLLGAGTIWIARRPSGRKTGIGLLALWAVCAAGLYGLYGGLPILDDPTERAQLALEQHYAMGHVQRGELTGVNPFTEYRAIWTETFGEATGISGALTANPTAMLAHVGHNGWILATERLGMIVQHFPIILPGNNPAAMAVEAWALAFLLGLGLILALSGRSRRVAAWRRYKVLALRLAPIAGVSLAAAILVYPRNHYVLFLDVLLFLLVVLIVANAFPIGQEISTLRRRQVLIGLSVALLAATPSPHALPFDHQLKGQYVAGRLTGDVSIHRQKFALIEAFQQLAPERPVTLMTYPWGLGIYLGPGVTQIGSFQKIGPFSDYLRTTGIEIILTAYDLGQETVFRDDPEWRRFLDDPGAFGFVPLPVDSAVQAYAHIGLDCAAEAPLCRHLNAARRPDGKHPDTDTPRSGPPLNVSTVTDRTGPGDTGDKEPAAAP